MKAGDKVADAVKAGDKVADAAKAADKAGDAGKAADKAADLTKTANGGAADEAFKVTRDGVALPKGSKHEIPGRYVENPHRPSSYGEMVDGKFKERLRIDPATPPGQKGPNTSHYHKDGKGTHFSPAPGNKDPGFSP